MLRLDRALPLTGSDRNPYHATISTFVYALKKSLDKYLVRGVRDGAPRFSEWKRKVVYEKSIKIFLNLIVSEHSLFRTWSMFFHSLCTNFAAAFHNWLFTTVSISRFIILPSQLYQFWRSARLNEISRRTQFARNPLFIKIIWRISKFRMSGYWFVPNSWVCLKFSCRNRLFIFSRKSFFVEILWNILGLAFRGCSSDGRALA